MNLNDVVFNLKARTQNFKQGFKKAENMVKNFDNTVNKGRDKLRRFNETLDRGANKARNYSLVLFGVTAAMGAMINKTLKTASSAQELQNVLVQSFGSMSKEINEWAETTGDAMNRSHAQMKEFVAFNQALIKPALGVNEQTKEMSQNLTALAVDFGSFFEKSDKRMFDAIQSGLMGMVRPLRAVGVDMTEATLKSWALKQGIEANIEEMGLGEKVMLRYQYLMEKTTHIQGDAIRTAKSYANQKKALHAEIENITELIGKGYLPIASKIIQAIVKGARSTRDWINENSELAAKLITISLGIMAVLASLGTFTTGIYIVIKALKILSTIATVIFSPFLMKLGLIITSVGLLATAWKNDWGGIQDKTEKVWNVLEPIFDSMKEFAGKLVETTWSWIVLGIDMLDYMFNDFVPWLLTEVPDFIEKNVEWTVKVIQDIAIGFIHFAANTIKWVIEVGQNIATGFVYFKEETIPWIINLVKGKIKAAKSWLVQTRNWLINFVEGRIIAVDKWLIQTKNWFINLVQGSIIAGKNWLEQTVGWFINLTEGTISASQPWLEQTTNWVVNLIKGAITISKNWLIQTRDWVVNLKQGIMGRVSTWIDKIINWYVDLERGISGAVDFWVDRIVTWYVDLKRGISGAINYWIDRIINWYVELKKGAEKLTEWINRPITWVVNLAKGVLGETIDWINKPVNWIANLVGVVPEKGNQLAEWLLGLVDGKEKSEKVDIPVNINADIEDTDRDKWGTKLNNAIQSLIEKLQWTEITEKEFNKLKEEYGEQADDLLKITEDKFYAKTPQKLEKAVDLALDFVVTAGAYLVGKTVFTTLAKAASYFLKHLGPIAAVASALLTVKYKIEEFKKAKEKGRTPEAVGGDLVMGIMAGALAFGVSLNPVAGVLAFSLVANLKLGEEFAILVEKYVIGPLRKAYGFLKAISDFFTGGGVKTVPEQVENWLKESGVDSGDELTEEKRRKMDEEILGNLKKQGYKFDNVESDYEDIEDELKEKTIKNLQELEDEYGKHYARLIMMAQQNGIEIGNKTLDEILLAVEDKYPALLDAYARIYGDIDKKIQKIMGNSLDKVMEKVADKTGTPFELLLSIGVQEGSEKAKFGVLEEGMNKEFKERVNELTEELFGKTFEVESVEFQAAAAALSAEGYWEKFQEKFKQYQNKTLTELSKEGRNKFIKFMGTGYAPIGAENDPDNLNKNWVEKVSILMEEVMAVMNASGVDSVEEFVKGVQSGQDKFVDQLSQSTIKFLSEGNLIYDDAENDKNARRWGIDLITHFLKGVKSKTKSGTKLIQNVADKILMPLMFDVAENDKMMKDSGEDAVKEFAGGVDKGKNWVEKSLENVMSAFNSIKEKLPENIREPLQVIVDYIAGLNEEVEKGLKGVENLQAEIDALLSGGKITDNELLNNIKKNIKTLFADINALTAFISTWDFAKLREVILVNIQNAFKLISIDLQKAGNYLSEKLKDTSKKWNKWLLDIENKEPENMNMLEKSVSWVTEKVNNFSSVLTQLIGGVGNLVSFIMTLLSSTKAFQYIVEIFDYLMKESIALVEGIVVSLFPILESFGMVLLAIIKGLEPIIKIITAIITPVFEFFGEIINFFAETVKGVANMFIDIYNWLADSWLGNALGLKSMEKYEEDSPDKGDYPWGDSGDIDESERPSAGQVTTYVSGKFRDELRDLLKPVVALSQLPTYLNRVPEIPTILNKIAQINTDISNKISQMIIGTTVATANEASFGGNPINIYIDKIDEKYDFSKLMKDIKKELGSNIVMMKKEKGN